MKNLNSNKIIYIAILLILTLIVTLTPLGLYFLKFHKNLSSDFNKWSAFGSYVGGIYGPIFTLLSLAVLVWTLFQMRSSQTQDKEHFQIQLDEQKRQLEEQQKQKSIDEIIMLINMIKIAIDNNPIVNDMKEFYREHLSSLHENSLWRKPKDIQDVWEISYNFMKKEKFFDSEVHILGEVLERISQIQDPEIKKRIKIITKGLLPQQYRFLFKSYAFAQHPKAAQHLKTWPDFCHVPADFKNYIKWFGSIN